MMDRDRILTADDETLSAECRLDFYKDTGKGGQKRNKTSSAVRVTHAESGLSASDCSGRSQHDNRSRALRKLKMLAALEFRCEPQALSRMVCATESDDYPLWCARVLDYLEKAEWEPKMAATEMGHTTSGLVKLLYRDAGLWQWVNKRRMERSLPPLQK